MSRLSKLLAHLAVAIGLGAVAIGHPVLLAALEQQTQLIDANLAKSVALPVLMRLDEVVLAVSVVACLTVRRATGFKVGTTFALLAVMLASFDRLWLLPELSQAWSRVDLTVGRPLDRLATAETLERISLAVAAGLAAVFGGMLWTLSHRSSGSRPSE